MLLCKNELFSNANSINIGDKSQCIIEEESWCKKCEQNINAFCTNKKCNVKENKYEYNCRKIEI
jgi:hypothetical protein